LNINASNTDSFKIRLKNLSKNTSLKLKWKRTTDSTWSDTRSVTININNNRTNWNYELYTKDLSSTSDWNGTIDQIRIESGQTPYFGGWAIDYIVFD